MEREQKLMQMNPTLIGTVTGVKFYEHPIYGDESDLMAVDSEGNFTEHTGYYELPDFWDIAE